MGLGFSMVAVTASCRMCKAAATADPAANQRDPEAFGRSGADLPETRRFGGESPHGP
jgi:hypothetical protein